MGPTKNASAYVGRLGGLAVALGVGAAIFGAAGMAWADSSDSGSSGSSTHGASAPGSSGADSASTKPAKSVATGPSRLGTAPSAPSASSSRAAARPTARGNSASTPKASAPATSTPAAGGAARPVRAATLSTPTQTGPALTAQSTPPAATGQLSSASVTDTGQAPGAPTPDAEVVASGLATTARRVQARTMSATASSTTSRTATLAAAVVTSTPNSLPSAPVGWVTGQVNSGYPGIGWPQTNNTAGFGIWGTDLGIMWENGLTGKIQLAFGDTFSGPNMTGDWRSNVLLLSTDKNLSNGLSLLPTGYAYQFIPSAPGALFPLLGSEVTVIPTSAVSVRDQQYVNYMSVRSWDTPGRWTTNYSAISMYNQATDKWVLVPSTIRSASWFGSTTPYVPGNQNFQQAAYVLQPADQVAEGDTQYLYAFGTPSGRAGSAYLSRVAVGDVTDLSKYQYWNGSDWVTGKPVAAVPIIGDSPNSAGIFGPIIDWANDPNVLGGYLGGLFGAKTGGNVSEMSVQYNDYLGKYVMMYADGNNNIQLRYADQPNGQWSAPITVATSAAYPGLYAPMIHPWSGTGKLVDDNGDPDVSTLYWNMSLWGNYNVVLMETDLSPLKTTVV
ncbi:carbohydrate-binding protein [Mycolicibacterium litorale]|nr:carbohydrate-binding protein [Mycolicibacterium litorale]